MIRSRHAFSVTSVTALALLAGSVVLAISRGDGPQPPETPPTAHPHVAPEDPGRRLVWSDEFTGAAGEPPDRSSWTPEVGGSWGNNELQYYTDERANSSLDGEGHLRLTVQREPYRGPDGVARDYTSARLTTRWNQAFRYGRIEARIKLPHGPGLWPAFWMVGANLEDVGWPASGEVDIMEAKNDMTWTLFSVKGPRRDGTVWELGDTKDVTTPLSEDFHVYAVEWTPEGFTGYLDGEPFANGMRSDVPQDGRWVLDQDGHLILNIAVGGWAGPPDASTKLPQSMLVDWVRVYE